MSVKPYRTARAQAAGPLRRGHAALARGLDVAEEDRTGTGADKHGVADGLQLARRQVRRGRRAARARVSAVRGDQPIQGDRAELEADTVELGPGTRIRGTRADLPVHHVRGQLPV